MLSNKLHSQDSGKWDRRKWLKVGAWLLIVAIAPFAIEILILADIAGAEFALVFLFAYLKSVVMVLRERTTLVLAVLSQAIGTPVEHPLFVRKAYLVNVVASCLALWLTGSLVVMAQYA